MSADYDVIVVGAGSAGCAIAARLTEDPTVHVLLLEAGGSDRNLICTAPGMMSVIHTVPQVKQRIDWGFKTVPQPASLDRVMQATRGKVLGGSSAINGLLFVRGHRSDYDGWAAEGCEGWGWDDVLPAFKRLEDWEGDASDTRAKGGPIKVSRPPRDEMSPASTAFLDAVHEATGAPIVDDYNTGDHEGVARVQMSCRDGLRYSTSEGYLQPAMGRPNLTVLTGAHVHTLTMDGTRCTGVTYEVKGSLTQAHAPEVVLSAGAFGSPHLLMRSGIGPAAHLAEHGIDVVADLPVGEHLHDHLFFPLTFLAPNAGHYGTPLHFLSGMARFFLRGGGWFARSVFETVAFLKTDSSLPSPNLQLHCLPWAYPVNQDDTTKRPVVDTRAALTVQPTIIYPRSRGTVRLRSADPHAKPVIDPGYLTEAIDAEVLGQGIEITRAIMATSAMTAERAVELEPGATLTPEQLAHELKHRISTVYHPVGTCRMGSDERAVVGPDLRVRGIEGLRVADASIFPRITGGNTNVPSIMVGERCAEFMAAERR